MNDINYFLTEEEKFCNKHPTYGDFFFNEKYNEFDIVGSEDPMCFMTERPFSTYYSLMKEASDGEIKYALTAIEHVVLLLFYSKYSAKFRDDYYNNDIPELATKMFQVLDGIVAKAPQNRDDTLYRFCNMYDKCNMKKGDIITFTYNLTTTNYDWEQEQYKNVYIIYPLKNGKTKAHNLFEIICHGKENQVEFLRNTSFEVTNVLETVGTEYKKFYLQEI